MSPILITPRRFADARGWFSETFNAKKFAELGIENDFCQDNQSLSSERGTLRGLHFQVAPFAQAKIVRCLAGSIFDVAVDIRKDSPSFGRWVGAELSAENGKQLFVPNGYAHGFLTLESNCVVAYKVDAFYSAACEGGIVWNDKAIGIDWPLEGSAPCLSEKDSALQTLTDLEAQFDYDGRPMQALQEVQI
jgi:dTDP-4-dehydrorhamnose 3,5-epimerase